MATTLGNSHQSTELRHEEAEPIGASSQIESIKYLRNYVYCDIVHEANVQFL